MKRTVCFLVGGFEALPRGNLYYLTRAFRERGWHPEVGTIDSLAAIDGQLETRLRSALPAPGSPLRFEEADYGRVDDFTVVWVLGFGLRESFLDKVQLLEPIDRAGRLINSLTTLLHLHSKHHLALLGDPRVPTPETICSNDFALLWAKVAAGGRWVAKPPARSFGRDVFLVHRDDPNARAILQRLTADGHCLLQRYVTDVASGDKRVLIAGGQPVGAYLRLAPADDHRTNLEQGAAARPCQLTAPERDRALSLGEFLLERGARFVGVDLVYPYVMEFNVVNPGGLATIDTLGGRDLSGEVLDHVLASLGTA